MFWILQIHFHSLSFGHHHVLALFHVLFLWLTQYSYCFFKPFFTWGFFPNPFQCCLVLHIHFLSPSDHRVFTLYFMFYFCDLHNIHIAHSHGWKSFKVYHTRRKRPSHYDNPFLPCISIPIKNNESKVVKFFKKIIF
jgi:hypothetical protein